tara:strand:+ start:268 stop:447 length:180 start_codon:yes stop_codon:yes gene_type:complete
MKGTIVNTICGFEDSTIFEGTKVDVLEVYTKDNRVKVRCPRKFIYVLGLEDVKIENERR